MIPKNQDVMRFYFNKNKNGPVFIGQNPFSDYFAISLRQDLHIFFPLTDKSSVSAAQKMQRGRCFLIIILSPSLVISTGSLQLMSSAFLISFGTTRRPSSSIFRTIPIDFIAFPLSAEDIGSNFLG